MGQLELSKRFHDSFHHKNFIGVITGVVFIVYLRFISLRFATPPPVSRGVLAPPLEVSSVILIIGKAPIVLVLDNMILSGQVIGDQVSVLVIESNWGQL